MFNKPLNVSFTEEGKLLFSSPCNPPLRALRASSSICLGVFQGPVGGGPDVVTELSFVQIPPAALHSCSEVYLGPSEQVPLSSEAPVDV